MGYYQNLDSLSSIYPRGVSFPTPVQTLFTLQDYSFEGDTSTTAFMKGGQLGQDWGVQDDTNFYNNNNPLPFMKKNTAPIPYIPSKIIDSSDHTLRVRSFPNGNVTSAQHLGNTNVEYIELDKESFESTTISYDSSTFKLTVKGKEITCYPHVIIDIQAPGGDGGMSDHAELSRTHHGYNNGFHLISSAGGGSGAFISLAMNLSQITPLTLTKDRKTETITAKNTTIEQYCNFILSDNNTQLIIGGGNGSSAAYVSGDDPPTKTTVSLKGNGGEIKYKAINGNPAEIPVKTGDRILNARVLLAVDGVAGGASAFIQSGYWSGSNPSFLGGGASEDYTTHSFAILPINSLPAISCRLYDNLRKESSKGVGETEDAQGESSAYHIAGGGGGAPSLMSDGGSWVSGGGTAGIGAGGHGASAWCKSRGEPGSEKGGKGGNGAMWIYYIPKT